MVRIVLDTDIGTDVDDCLALTLALRSPDVRLEAVTTVYGDVDLRARMVRKLLRLAGAEGVPVGKGVSLPLLRARPVYWAGHEGQGLLEPADAHLSNGLPHAVDLIISTVMAHPGEITLVTIGPLTNAAVALIREPRLAQDLKEIVVMGGVARVGPNALGSPWVEHNIRCDPEAAQVVFGAGIPLTMVGLDVTMQVRVTREGLDRMAAVGTPLLDAAADQLRLYLGYAGRDWTYLHDPLALAVAVDRGLVDLRPMRVDVETRGDLTAGATAAVVPGTKSANANLAVAVDAARFERAFVDTVCR